jgi:hypothetical protein
MILYHGSSVEVKKPDLVYSRIKTDFGTGFYTTPYREQAEKWAMRFKRSEKSGVVSAYEFSDDILSSGQIKVLEFDAYSEEWLDFVTECRKGLITGDRYDLIIGSVANDKVFDAVEAYFNGFFDKEKAIERLRYEKPNLQYCFKNNETIDKYLKFKGMEAL